MEMAAGHDLEWYTDESMIQSIVEDMEANTGQPPPVTSSVASFVNWVREPPPPRFATDESRPVMFESFMIVVKATTTAAFRNQAAWARRQTPAASLTVDRFGNEVQRPAHGPLMLLPSLPTTILEAVSNDEEVKRVSFV